MDGRYASSTPQRAAVHRVDFVGEQRLGDSRRAQRARANDRSRRDARRESRQQRVGEHAAHLSRNAGEHRDPPAALILEPHAGRRPVAILELRRAHRHHRLLLVRRGERTVESRPPALLHPAKVFLVELHSSAEQLGDRLLGEIVGGGAETARRDDGAAALERLADGALDRRGRVADRRPAHDMHSNRRERSRRVRRVRVDGEAEEQLVADRHDLHRGAALGPARHF